MSFNGTLLREIRGKFPYIKKDAKGRKRIFFDSGAGTQVLASSVRSMSKTAMSCSANTGSNYPESAQTEDMIRQGRDAISEFFNAENSQTMISAESSTSLFFRLAYAIGKETEGKGNVVSTYMEHLANASPWFEMGRRGWVEETRWVRLKEDTTLDMDDLAGKIDKNTKVVSVSAAANLFGTKTDLMKIGKIAHEAGAYFVVDAVHHAPHGPIDVQDIDCDFLAMSMYKVFGPKYICFMYGKLDLLEKLKPYSVERNISAVPDKWEQGSPDPSKFAAVSATMDYFVWLSKHMGKTKSSDLGRYSGRKRALKLAMAGIEEYEKEISKAMLTGINDAPGLPEIAGLEFYGIKDIDRLNERDPTFAFRFLGHEGKDVEQMFVKKYGIDLRYVFDSWNMAHNFWNIPTMARASLAHYNTVDEVHQFLKAANAISKRYR